MLTPGYLAGLPAPMVELYSQLESDIVCDMARRISKMGAVTETANYQAWRLEQLAGFQKSTQKKLARMTGKTERQLRAMFRQAARDAVAADSVIYEAAGLSPKPPSKNAALNQIVQACEKQTLGVFENLTRTTANTATRQFERALDRAALQIGSGAFDYRTAIRRAVKDLSGQGIETIVYSKGGRVTQRAHLDVAVRRAVLTGVNQMAAQVSLANAQLLGCDLVETTAHQGARPEHTEWQGKIFSISGRHPKYPQLAKATGYGTGDGLCGWNCRHSFYPYFEGLSEPAYTKESLDDMAAATVFYNGEELTQYDASQRQRAIERNIRRWKREYLAMEAAGEDTTEAALKLKKWRAVQAAFCRQTGLRVDGFRGQVVGFGRSQASKATWAAKKISLNPENHATIKAITGGRITNPSGKAANEHAERYYGLVRSMKTDAALIAKNTGYTEAQITAIKKYLFIDKHDLGDPEPRRFDADFAIAQSWQRLMAGTPELHDLTLLKHEILERQLMDGGMSQNDAHILASASHNYSKEADEYYGSLKKHRNK
ncbi:MAG: phage minor capsid protein [Oscillospiraceae bacterium]|nr:phage minor capsid protein [Oscillospiraceae bacterium]